MANVVRELQTEVFVLSLSEPMKALPVIPGYGVRERNSTEIEVEVAKGQGLNDAFSALSEQSLKIVSMRTKSNRLEELFIRLVGDRSQGAAA
jgi:ABC-2 type transport system ATP-binding protein